MKISFNLESQEVEITIKATNGQWQSYSMNAVAARQASETLAHRNNRKGRQ